MGVEKIIKALEKHGRAYQRANIASLLAEGFDVMAKSVPLVPVEFSVLRNSRYVAVVGGISAAVRAKVAEIELGYGTDYAVPVHEKHEVSHRVGQSNYLRQPFDAAKAGMRQRVARRTQSFFRLGIGPGAIPKAVPSKPRVKERPRKKRKNR